MGGTATIPNIGSDSTDPPNMPTASATDTQPTQQPTPQTPPQQQPQAAPTQQQQEPTETSPSPSNLVVLTPHKPGGLLGVMDDIARVLVGGQTRPEIATGSDGNKYVKENTLSRGEQWQRIAGEVLQGAAAGLAAGKGAGNMGNAPLAGVQAQQQQQERENQQRQQMTAEARQENIDRGNRVLQNMQLTKLNWDLTNAQHVASENDVKFYKGQLDDYVKQGGTVLGTAKTPNDIAPILKMSPDAVQQAIVHGTIISVPAVDDDGKRMGNTFIRMPDNFASELLPAGTEFPVWDDVKHEITYQNSADPISKAQFQQYTQAAGVKQQAYAEAQHKQKLEDDKAQLEARKEKSTEAVQRSESARNYAEAQRAHAQAVNLNQATDAATIQSNAQQLVDASADPTNLSKRGKTYDPTLAAANAYSMQKYGKPFDIAKAVADYKYATQPSTTNTLNYLNSLVGHDNKGGNLAVVVDMSNKLPRTQFPPLNKAEQWAKLSSGNAQIAAYYAALTETSDQIAKILQGGGTGSGTSDAKLRQAGELMDKGFTPQQMDAVANDSLRPLLGNRKNEIIGTNRYLQRWYGQQPQQQQFSLSKWKQANPNGDAVAAEAEAKKQGFEVIQ
jgi:hypothetical protein